MNDFDSGDGDSSASKAYLIVQRGEARLEVVDMPTQGTLTIGRAPSNRIVIPDAKCSRQHCELIRKGRRWVLRDLDSRNGVTVNDERVIGEQLLEFGDIVGIGNCRLSVSESHPDESQETSDSLQRFVRRDSDQYEIIDRKSGTQYDGLSGMDRIHRHSTGATDLFRFARAMATAHSEGDLCQIVLDGLAVRTGAAFGGIFLITPPAEEEGEPLLEPRAIRGDRPASQFSTYLSSVVAREQDAVLAHDISQNKELGAQESLQKLEVESAICAPIRHQRAVLGVIHLYGTNVEHPFTQEDLEFVLAVADQMGDQLFALLQRLELEEGLDRVRRHVSGLQDQLAAETELVGNSPRLEEMRKAIARIARTDALVLIRGESGVGKELVARAVHFNSHRKDGPFVCVNCAALTESLLESELFGHEKGAFTGASARRAGKFEQADGGTLFLDEIGEMSPEIQAKFLRVLEGQAFERVGGGEPITVDVRLVTATNRNLEEAVRDKRFRRDLFFRLQVIEIVVPPLREHPEDVPAIAQHFLLRFAAQAHRRVRGFNTAAILKLQQHDWPGNVRELRNVVERAVILAEHEILGPDDIVLTHLQLDDEFAPAGPGGNSLQALTETSYDTSVDPWGGFVSQSLSLDEIDRLYIEAVLEATDWNKSRASRILQIERTTLDRRLKKYGVNRPGEDD